MSFDLSKLSASSGELIAEYKDTVSAIEVRETSCFRWLYTGGVAIQSIINKDDPETILLPVPKALLLGGLWIPNLSNILNLGVGGGTIERALVKNKLLKVTSVEAEANIINIARRYFDFPQHHPIIESCALDYLSADKQRHDLIIVDLFNVELMPTFCYLSSFYQLLNNRLSITGVIAINLHPKSENELLNILLLNKTIFSNIALVKFANYQNIVLLLSHQFIPDQDDLKLMNNVNNLLGVDVNEAINSIVYVVNPKSSPMQPITESIEKPIDRVN